MAYDDDLNLDNWDDPFNGEFDFDMDFDADPFKGKGFIKSTMTGFLSGLVDETVGSNKARVRTLRTILPSTFSNAFDRASRVADRFEDLKEEFRQQNTESVRSLQTIAAKVGEKYGEKLPGGIGAKISEFSQKDFSHWEKGSSTAYREQMGEASEWEVTSVINEMIDSQGGMFAGLADSLNSMTAAASGGITSAIMSGNKQLINIETGVRDLLDYQRKVQLKMDQAKVNLMAKTYVANIKYYKFVEAGMHAQVTELKKILQGVMMSDYQKTSTYTASKQYMRSSLFSTVGKRVGGLGGLIRERFGKNVRGEAYEGVGGFLGTIAQGIEMSEGTPMSKGMVGDVIGRAIAEQVVNNIPYFLTSGRGKEAISKLAARNPEKAAQFKQRYDKLANVGSRASYMANAGMGLVNHMAEDYEAIDEMPFLDYQDYLDQLPEGKKPMSKTRWTAQNALRNRAASSMNSFMSEMTRTKGTQYVLKRRDPKDLLQAGVWTNANNVTLTEVIPGLISRTNQLLEMIRTGNDNAEMTSYNYMRGQFQNETQRQVSAQSDLMPFSDFSRFANAALEFVDDLDPDKQLSATARKEFAKIIAKDVDQEKAFNPFYYVGEIPGVSGSVQSEIQALMRSYFGLKTDDIERYKSSKGFDRINVMTTMPNAEAQARLNKAGASSANLKETMPNVAERIDMLRATGNEQLLRDLGIIYTDNGIDRVNMKLFHDRIGMFMDDPNNPILRGVTPGGESKPGTRNKFDIPDRPDKRSPQGEGASFAGLSSSLNDLTSKLDSLAAGNINTTQTPLTAGEPMLSNLEVISQNTGKMELLLGNLVEMAKAGKLFTGQPASVQAEKEEQRTRESITEKLKNVLPKDLMTKGVATLLNNSPMVIGGVLGAIGSNFMSNPIAAAGMAVGGLALGGIAQHFLNKGTPAGSEPSDDENVTDENGETILEAAKLKAGMYVDAVTKRVIESYKSIKGPIIDISTKAVISLKELGGRLFGAEGRAVALRGITAAKNALIDGYNFVNPLGRLQDGIDLGKSILYQQDVFVKSDPKKPRLRSVGFKNVSYWKDVNGTFTPVKGWNEIDGPVFDDEGNELISQDEFEAGLVTATGQQVRNVGGMASNMMGATMGAGRKLMDNMLGRFGFTKQTDGKAADVSSSMFGKANGVERRLDRIYKLLSQQFGIDVPEEDGDPRSPTTRLNSLADKIRQAKEAKSEQVQEAIIDIGESVSGKKDKKGKKDPGEKKDGVFGKLFEMFGSMGNFFKNPLGSLLGGIGGSLAASTGRLASIGTALFSGVLGVASPLFKMLSSGLGVIAKGLGAGAGLMGRGVGGLLTGGRQTGRMGKMARAGGRLGLLAGAGVMASELFGSSPEEQIYEGTGKPNVFNNAPEEKSVLDHATELAEWHPAIGLPSMALTAVAPGLVDTLKNTGIFFSSDGEFFTDKQEMKQHEDNLTGYKVDGTTYRSTLLTTSLQKRIRFAMYGIKDWKSSLARKVDRLELMLLPHIVISGNTANFKNPEKIAELFEQFAQSAAPISPENVLNWLDIRFKQIFLTYAIAATVGRYGDITEFDNAKEFGAVLVTERVRNAFGSMKVHPYTIDYSIDAETGIMTRMATEATVSGMITKLRKEYPDPDKDTKINTYDEQRQQNLNPETSDNKVVAWFQNTFGNDSLRDSQNALDKRFAVPVEVKEIDISDLHKDGNTPIDPFTMARLALYGNTDNVNWRVDAVLKLERYCEAQMAGSVSNVKFNVSTDSVLKLFSPMFRLSDPVTEQNWKIWFEKRFLTIMKEYFRLMLAYRGQAPKKAWQQLSATNKAEIANKLMELMVVIDGRDTSVWDIKESPFPASQSGTAPDRAATYVKALDSKAMQQSLKDPVMEQAASKTVTDVAADAVANKQAAERRAVQAKLTSMGANQNRNPNLGKNYASKGFANAFPMGTDGKIGGVGSGGAYEGSFDESFSINPELKSGDDQGIKMTPEQGEQLLLNALLKAGITDNKQIALALALAKVETGNYRATVENTNWSADALQRYFKNIPDRATAEKVAAMSPEARAMYVYGRAPKGPQLGNEKPEDGWLYRGRGLFQLTGKSNYEQYKKETGIDVVSNPRLVSEDPNVIADSAVRFLMNNKAIKSIATDGDFEKAVRGINGGNAVPFTDERRKAYSDYLGKLQSGSLKIKGNEISDFAPKEETAGNTEVPAGADKNVPDAAKDVVETNTKGAQSNKEKIDDILNNSTKTQNTAIANTKTSIPTPPVTAQAPAPAPAASPSGPVSTSAPGGKAGTPPVVAQSARPAGPVSAVTPPKSGKPELNKVSDEGVQALLAQSVAQLGEINKSLLELSKGKGNGYVSVN